MAATGLTDGELTVLGLLAEQPRHGYDLDRVIEARGVRVWTSLGFSSIYYLLDRLAARGLIEPATRQGQGRGRTVFRPTTAGYQRLAEQSADALESLTPVRARVLTGMANSPVLAPTEVNRRLRRRIDLISAELERLRRRRTEQQPLPEHVEAIFAYGEALLRADLGWAEHLLRKGKTMEKYDLKAARRDLYAPRTGDFRLVDVPAMSYLAIDGSGDPNTSAGYATAVEALYTIAYGIKAHSRTVLGRDFVVPPLEGLWWADDMSAFTRREKSAWHWTMLIALPDWIDDETVATARTAALKKKNLPAIDAASVRTLHEGRSVQILHIGPYDDETAVLERLHRTYLPGNGLVPNGRHHEIYLSDARRTPPAKLKTILRQPVKPAHPHPPEHPAVDPG